MGDGFVTSSSTGNFICQIGPYIAPEVRAGKSKSHASDAYSFGRVGRKIINLWRWIVSESSQPVYALDTVPKGLKTILDQCIAENPEGRPEMGLVCSQLEKLEPLVEAGQVEWVDWIVDRQEFLEDKPIKSNIGDLSQAEAELEDIEIEHAMG